MEILFNILNVIIVSIGVVAFISWINSLDKENKCVQSKNNWHEVDFNSLDEVYKIIASADNDNNDYWFIK